MCRICFLYSYSCLLYCLKQCICITIMHLCASWKDGFGSSSSQWTLTPPRFVSIGFGQYWTLRILLLHCVCRAGCSQPQERRRNCSGGKRQFLFPFRRLVPEREKVNMSRLNNDAALCVFGSVFHPTNKSFYS